MAPTTLRPAALAAGLLVAALATPATALAIENGTDPIVTVPAYPGTTTAVGGWDLIGNIRRPAPLDATDGGGVSGVLIAPRLVLASAHGAGEQGGTYVSPSGATAKIVANALRAGQRRANQQDGTADGNADISLSLLDRDLPTPPGGFPLLLTDRLTEGLVPSLPGFVLWGGRGGTTAGKSLVGWGRPGGTPIASEARLATVEGDSGSTGLLYRSATARPIMPGVNVFTSKTQLGQVDLLFGGVPSNVTLADPLVLGTTATTKYATVGAWLTAAINSLVAANPGLQQPVFTTLAGAGIDLTTLRPTAPSFFRNTASATSTTLTWDNPTETRIPRTGYRITDSANPAQPVTTTGTSVTVSGLSPSVEHHLTLRAYNANGDSPDQRSWFGEDSSTLIYARPVTGLTVTTELVNGPSGPDYCATATWSAPVTDPGTVIDSYDVDLGGTYVLPELGATRAKRCGLSPSQLQTVTVQPVVGPAVGAPASASAMTPPAPARLPAPTNLKVTEQKTLFSGRCLTVTWTRPATTTGLTLTSQAAKFTNAATGSILGNLTGLSATATSAKQCSAVRSTRYAILVTANLKRSTGETVSTTATTEFTTAP